MAIVTNNEKLAIIEWDSVFEPAIPLSPGASFSQGDKQQLLWGYPGINWIGLTVAVSQGFTVYVN